MKVFVVLRDFGYDGTEIIAACASRELADARAAADTGGVAHEIEEFELEESPQRRDERTGAEHG
jgi:hypothetical protein